jgi:hypothetical protein
MKRGHARLAAIAIAVAALALSACSSWDTGSDPGDSAEQACLEMIDTFARAAERCGAEYKPTYDELLMRNANGDCKNVRTLRDEAALRKTCLPFVRTQSCTDQHDGLIDPSCAAQLQRAL